MEFHPDSRYFKSALFSKAARKAHISDQDLYEAMCEVTKGQTDDLGGGVFKKRLNKNLYRGIVVVGRGKFWIFTYLFAKKERANIAHAELIEFRKLSTIFGSKTDVAIARDIEAGVLEEIIR